MSLQEKILIIDGNALIHRAYHALPDFKSKDGVPTNAVYGFASVLLKVQSDILPTHILVCFDTPEPTFRDELFTEYRTQRPQTDDNLIKQFPMVDAFLDSAGIPYYKKPGFEADDLIAVATKGAREHGMNVVILTGDKDIFQLVTDHVCVLTPAIGFSQGKLYDPDAVTEKFGIPPESIPDYKALAGDPSDNYRGVKGIGPKSAVALLKQFGSVENVYERIDDVTNERVQTLLRTDKEHALLSKKLAMLVDTIDDYEIDIDGSVFNHYNESLRDFFDLYEFRTLEKRFFPMKRPEKKMQLPPEASTVDQPGLF